MIYNVETLRAVGISPEGLQFCGEFPPYAPELVELASSLRNNSNKSEVYLWKVLQLCRQEYKFIRQKPILRYIADFYCHQLSVVVEIDGFTHNGEESQSRDMRRDKEMQALGLRVIRLNDKEVRKNPYGAAQYIFVALGLLVPEKLDFLATGNERVFPVGYRRKS